MKKLMRVLGMICLFIAIFGMAPFAFAIPPTEVALAQICVIHHIGAQPSEKICVVAVQNQEDINTEAMATMPQQEDCAIQTLIRLDSVGPAFTPETITEVVTIAKVLHLIDGTLVCHHDAQYLGEHQGIGVRGHSNIIQRVNIETLIPMMSLKTALYVPGKNNNRVAMILCQ